MTLAPRGHAKTEVLTMAYALWKLAVDVNTRILIVSNTAAQARRFLRQVKGHIQTNELLKAFFPEFARPAVDDRLRPWGSAEISLSSKTSNTKEPNITARGVHGDIIGMHYDIVLIDDIVDEESARSPVQREHLLDWWGMTLVPTLEPGGELHIVGTRYHVQDLYGAFIGTDDKPGQWADVTTISRAIDDEGQALWPDIFPLDELESRKEELGTIRFNAQYQNDVRAMRGAMFKPEWFQYYTELPEGLRPDCYMGVDLAIGTGDQHDYTAIVCVAVDHTGRIWILDAWHGRVSFVHQLEQVQAMYNIWRGDERVKGPHVVAVEKVAYQAAFTQELIRTSSVPVAECIPSRDKVTRAHSLSVHVENGKVFLREGDRLLEDELLLFPEGEHDDLVDALVYSVQASEMGAIQDTPLYIGGDMRVA